MRLCFTFHGSSTLDCAHTVPLVSRDQMLSSTDSLGADSAAVPASTVQVAVLKPGTMFGETGVIMNEPRSAQISCITDVRLFLTC
jgi:CRP-like cAMP-binding protein